MVRALLNGDKTMTRRIAWRSETDKSKMSFLCDGERPNPLARKSRGFGVQMGGEYWLRPTTWVGVKPGDRLWVRESLQCFNRATAQYAADLTPVEGIDPVDKAIDGRAKWTWKNSALPSIHMPRWASRLTLIVTAHKIEGLQDINEADAMAEGVQRAVAGSGENAAGVAYAIFTFRTGFVRIWRELHGDTAWEENPEVVALTFTVHKSNIDSLPKSEAV